MTAVELQHWLLAGGGPLCLDTNVLFQHRRLMELGNQLNRLKRRQVALHTQLYVPAVVHAEKLHDLRQQFRDRYDASVILSGMRSKGIEVRDFTPQHAEHLAMLLGQRYPTPADWHGFKRQLYLGRLGLPKSLWQEAPATGQHCGATVDWLIAAQADCEGWLLVTEDAGIEFGANRKTGLGPLEAAFSAILAG